MYFPSLDNVQALRDETPGCRNVIHFNNAGAALMPQPVIDVVKQHIDLEAAIGGYEAAAKSADQYQNTYASIARLINCKSEEVGLVVNATRAWDMAFYSFNFERGDKILTAMSEYVSNYLAFLQVARRTGAEVIPVPNDDSGQLSPDELERLIDDRVKLIAVTHVPTNGGLVNPASEIGAVARNHNIPFLLDACQSAGQIPLDVEDIGCDILTATGRKYLRGPRGTGFLYVRQKLIPQLEPPFIDLRSADWTSSGSYSWATTARRFETWENNVAGMIGLGVAVDYAMAIGLDRIEDRVVVLANELRTRLTEIDGITVHDLGKKKCGIVSLTVDGFSSDDVKEHLAARRINVTVSAPDSTLLDASNRNLPPIVRASVHYYNTVEEIETLCSCLADLVN
ncbi:MAG: aminotransferase class V-fold PLP-dependent enzyme [Rhodothermales bacterium]|nr:aminotransferase class V-fold PLP-dependent enzyme [Rhodothermales bacterium]